MTGLFVHLQRHGPDGPSGPVDVEEMTDAALDALDPMQAERPAWQLWTWCKTLARCLRDTTRTPLLATVVTHPAFVSLAQDSEGVYVLMMHDPCGQPWDTAGSLESCLLEAMDELPLQG